MKLTTEQNITFGFALAICLLMAVGWLAYNSTSQHIELVQSRREASRRGEMISSFVSLLKDAETGQRGYLLTGNVAYLVSYDGAKSLWRSELSRLQDELERGSTTGKLAATIPEIVEELFGGLARSVELKQQNAVVSQAEWNALLRDDKHRMDELLLLFKQLAIHQQREYEAISDRVERSSRWTLAVVSIICPLAVILVGLSGWQIRRDLQRREQAEEQVHQQRVLLAAVLDSLSEGVIVFNEAGTLTRFNSAAKRIHGQDVSQDPEQNWTEVYGLFRLDNITPFPMEELPAIRALAGERVELEEMIIRQPGANEGRMVACSAGPMVDENGRNRGAVVVIRDITASRAAERMFQDLLESAPDAMILINRQGRIVLVNGQAETLFGYDRDQMLGRAVEMLLPARFREHHPALREGFFVTPRNRSMGIGLELYGARADGSEFPLEISLAPVETQHEQWACAAVRDVTQQRSMYQQVRELNEQLEERVEQRTAALASANSELTQRNQENEMFVYSVSHDLRSPLVNLQGFSQELAQSCEQLKRSVESAPSLERLREEFSTIVDVDVRESIHFIRTSVDRLGGIIDAMLRLSRAGRVVYEWQVVNTQSVVQRVVDALHGTLADHNATITIDTLPTVWGDETAIELVFANLLHNALNYLDPERPGRIHVAVTAAAESGHEVTFAVTDNGIGIAPELQAKAFIAFQRLHPKHAAGEGMGLAIVHRIVERHGGRIRLESMVDHGSTFYVTLPLPPTETSLVVAARTTEGERL